MSANNSIHCFLDEANVASRLVQSHSMKVPKMQNKVPIMSASFHPSNERHSPGHLAQSTVSY